MEKDAADVHINVWVRTKQYKTLISFLRTAIVPSDVQVRTRILRTINRAEKKWGFIPRDFPNDGVPLEEAPLMWTPLQSAIFLYCVEQRPRTCQHPWADVMVRALMGFGAGAGGENYIGLLTYLLYLETTTQPPRGSENFPPDLATTLDNLINNSWTNEGIHGEFPRQNLRKK